MMGDAVASVCCHHFGISSGICCLIAWGVGAGWQPPLPLLLASLYKSVLSAKILAAYLFQPTQTEEIAIPFRSFSLQPLPGFRRVGAGSGFGGRPGRIAPHELHLRKSKKGHERCCPRCQHCPSRDNDGDQI